MSSSSDHPTHSEDRRFSIRLPRPLWIGLTGIALAIVAFGIGIGVPIYQEEVAIRRFEKLDCSCYRESRLPYWLQHWVGYDFLTDEIGRVWKAELGQPDISDADVPFIRSFSAVRILHLYDTSITDRGLANLGRLPDLAILDLSRTRVTDAGLQHLRQLPSLEVLSLSNTNITDDGLTYAAEIPNLDSISLDRTRVTAAGIVRFRKLRPTVEINLGDWEPEEEGDVRPTGPWLPRCW